MKLEPIFESPSVQEITERLARVQEKMKEHRLDWYACFQPDNVFYLTHFANFVHERPFVLLIPASGTPSFVVPKLEAAHINSRKVGEIELVEYFEYPAPQGRAWFDRMKAVLSSSKRVGVESACTLEIYDAIEAERVRVDIVDDLRLIKTPYEIGRMVYAANIASTAMAELLDQAEPGRPLRKVSAAGKATMLGLLMADNPSINPLATRADAIFQPPRYSDDPHNFTDLAMEMVEGGPHVSIINTVLNGYGSEIERTFFIGHVPEAAKKPYDAMMRARRLAFSMLTPGARLNDIDFAVHELLQPTGFLDHLPHRTGHGMGVTGHEGPFIAEGDMRIVEPGMCLTIEPGVYLPGIGGFRHSDTILVTEDGNVCLTHAPDSVEDMTLPLR